MALKTQDLEDQMESVVMKTISAIDKEEIKKRKKEKAEKKKQE
jgi:hypothetical protein